MMSLIIRIVVAAAIGFGVGMVARPDGGPSTSTAAPLIVTGSVR